MLPSFANVTVTVRRAPFKEQRGTTVRDWAAATEHEVAGCEVQPSSTSRDFERAEQLADSWRLYAPPGSDIEAGDRIVFEGTVFDIDGVPYTWKSPTGRVSNMQCRLVEWSG